MNLPDGVRGIVALTDTVRFSATHVHSLANGASETFLVETPPGEVWECLVAGFWVGGMAASTGTHRLEVFAVWTTDIPADAILLRSADVVVRGPAALPFLNCPMVPAADIVSRLPDSDAASILACTSLVVGRDVLVNDRFRIRYTNNTGVAQTNGRRYVFIGRRSLDVPV